MYQNTVILAQENAFEQVICKILIVLFGAKCADGESYLLENQYDFFQVLSRFSENFKMIRQQKYMACIVQTFKING